jgi:hypothetical protein
MKKKEEEEEEVLLWLWIAKDDDITPPSHMFLDFFVGGTCGPHNPKIVMQSFPIGNIINPLAQQLVGFIMVSFVKVLFTTN